MIYTVKAGDKWSLIAEKMTKQGAGQSAELAKHNNLTTMNQLSPGQLLIIPDAWLKETSIFDNKMLWIGGAALIGWYLYKQKGGVK